MIFLYSSKVFAVYINEDWKALLHYRKNSAESLIEDHSFFLHPDGHRDPQKELDFFVKKWTSSLKNAEDLMCLFPTRVAWILENEPQLDIYKQKARYCSDLLDFREKNKAESIDFIYATSYLGHPASMFGHAFLRLKQRNVSDYRSPVIDYSAEILGDPSFLSYAYQGIAGYFSGRYSIGPYYRKKHLYASMENRGLWIFSLNTKPLEIKRLVDHVWELRRIKNRYYFSSQNCAYNILRLISISTRNYDVIFDPKTRIFPLDIIHKLEKENMITGVKNEESLSSEIQKITWNLSQKQIDHVFKSIKKDTFQGLSSLELDFAAKWILYKNRHHIKELENYEKTKQSLVRVARLRSKYPLYVAENKNSHSESPHLSHGVQRLLFSAGRDVLRLEYRVAYHDALDPLRGYPLGLSLEFFSLNFQSDFEKMWLDNMRLFKMTSLYPVGKVFQKISWDFKFDIFFDSYFISYLQPDVSIGGAYLLGKFLNYGLFGVQLKTQKKDMLNTYIKFGTMSDFDKWKFLYEIIHYSQKSLEQKIFLGWGEEDYQLFSEIKISREKLSMNYGMKIFY
ncbi:MAG: DUF4105 domain-containing protein [Oligoflexales bacterium]